MILFLAQLMEDLSWAAPPTSRPSKTKIAIWIGSAAVVLLIAIVLFIRYRKGKSMLFIPPPQPHAVALKSLDDLESQIAEGNDRVFVQSVSDIVRIYIQERFGLRAPHRATEEFLFEASTSGQLSDEHQELLADFLVQCDQVKFARQSMVIDNMRALLDSARTFVNGTVPTQSAPKSSAKVQA